MDKVGKGKSFCFKHAIKIYIVSPPIVTASKLQYYFILPYYGKHSELEAKKLVKILLSIYPQINFFSIL